jgi:hypothetical protein
LLLDFGWIEKFIVGGNNAIRNFDDSHKFQQLHYPVE